MTRKDFQIVAECLKSSQPKGYSQVSDNGPNEAWRSVVIEFCDRFRLINPSFKRELFLEACGF